MGKDRGEMPCMPQREIIESLTLHTVVHHPLTAHFKGVISCRPIGKHPILFEWYGPNGVEVETEMGGSEAVNLSIGRYRVVATDSTNARADVLIEVEASNPEAVVITGYTVTDASTLHSRDGCVEILGYNLEGIRFLWTNGTITNDARLRDASCGTYSATPMDKNGRNLLVIHDCTPAKVSART
jgi:hypothetical protein